MFVRKIIRKQLVRIVTLTLPNDRPLATKNRLYVKLGPHGYAFKKGDYRNVDPLILQLMFHDVRASDRKKK